MLARKTDVRPLFIFGVVEAKNENTHLKAPSTGKKAFAPARLGLTTSQHEHARNTKRCSSSVSSTQAQERASASAT